MKKMLIALALLCMGISYAQEQESIFIGEGHWGLGGRFSLSSNNFQFKGEDFASSSENFTIYVMPKISYAIEDNWLLGLSLIYDYNNHEGSNEVITHVIGLGPNIQKYFPIVDNFAFNLEGSLEYRHGWSENSSSPTQNPFVQNSYSAAIRPGFSFLMGEHFALEANTGILSFTRNERSIDGIEERKEDLFRFSFDLSNIQFGAIYFF